MSENNIIFAIRNSVFISIFLSCILFIVFAPAYAIYLVTVLLVLCGFQRNNNHYGLILLLLFLWLVLNAVDVISFRNFVYSSDDFSSYYNNYLGFLKSGFNKDSFYEFGDFEIALPLLNYLFSLIINEPEPYKLKFIYALLQGAGVIFCSCKISKYCKLDFNKSVLLIALVLVFYKPIVAIQLSRQMFSSIFIVAFVFSIRRKQKIIYLLCALLFHTSTVILLPMALFLFRERNKKDLILTIIIISSTYFFVMLAYSVLRSSVIDIPILNKLDYVIRAVNDPDKIKQSILTSFLLAMYMLPLFIGVLINKRVKLKYNIFIVLLLLMVFCSFPGFNNRVLFPELYVFLGYYYFVVFFDNSDRNAIFCKIFIVLCFSFLFIQSHFNEQNRRFSNFELEPFYFINYFSQQESTINRDELE